VTTQVVAQVMAKVMLPVVKLVVPGVTARVGGCPGARDHDGYQDDGDPTDCGKVQPLRKLFRRPHAP
jgi:hypothetical protein